MVAVVLNTVGLEVKAGGIELVELGTSSTPASRAGCGSTRVRLRQRAELEREVRVDAFGLRVVQVVRERTRRAPTAREQPVVAEVRVEAARAEQTAGRRVVVDAHLRVALCYELQAAFVRPVVIRSDSPLDLVFLSTRLPCRTRPPKEIVTANMNLEDKKLHWCTSRVGSSRMSSRKGK